MRLIYFTDCKIDRYKKVLHQDEIPFEITAQGDPFFSESNIKALNESEEQFRAGKVVVKTIDELEALANT